MSPAGAGGPAVVSVVIPTIFEGPSLAHTLGGLRSVLPAAHELLVVVNGTCRSTAEQARALALQDPRVRAEIHDKALGKGRAILRGLRRAQGRVLGFVDADGPFDPAQVFGSLVRPVLAGEVDCAVASKWLGHSFGEVSNYDRFSKKLLSRALNLATRSLFRLPFSDTQGGAKFLSRGAWQAADHDFLCQGFDFDVELMWWLHRKGYRVREVYLPCRPSPRSSFRQWHLPRMVHNLVRLRLWGGPGPGAGPLRGNARPATAPGDPGRRPG